MAKELEIPASQPVPNLEKLSAGDAGLSNGIREQEFDYAALDIRELIATLKEEAQPKGLPFMAQKGEMQAILAQPDGKARAVIFDLVFARGDKSVTITAVPESDPRVVGLQAYADERTAE